MATVENVNELSHDKFDLWQTFDNGKGNFQLPGNHRAFFRVKKSYFSKLLSRVESRSKWGRNEDEKVNKRLKIAWKWFSKLSKIEHIIKIWLLEGWRGVSN